MTIKDYSTTASSNSALNSINVAEGMAPSLVNNVFRSSMADQKSAWIDKEWFIVGNGDTTNTYTRASSTSVTIGADVTSTHHVGRRIKIIGTNTSATGIFGKIATSSYSSPNTTLAFTFDSGSIHASDTTVDVYMGSTFTGPAIPVIDTDAQTENSAILPPSQQSIKAYVDSGTVTMTSKTLTSPVINTQISGTALLDEDDMASNSAVKIASQQSIKAYVDAQLTAQDVDITTDSGTIAIDLDSETLTIAGGTGLTSSATGNTITLNIDGTVVTESSTDTLINKTLTTPVIAEIDSGSTITLDATTDIILDADGGDILFKDGGTTIATLSNTSSDFVVTTGVADKDFVVKGDDNGSGVTALTLDMSDAGSAIFNSDITIGSKLKMPTNVANKILVADGTSFEEVDISGDATIASNGALTIGTGAVTSSKVGTGIDATKLADGSVTNAELQYINSLSSNAQTQISGKLTASSNLSDVASASTSRTNLGLGTIATQASSNVAITGGSVTGLGSPSNGSDASTKTYVDNLVTGLKTRIICKVATTANVDVTADLQNADTIDGVSLSTGDRILVKNQSSASANGLYTAVASGTASRDTDYDSMSELAGQMVIIQKGSTNADTIWLCTTDSDATLGSSSVAFSKVTPSNTGTVTSAGIAQSASEFTISGSPITSSGNVTIDVNRISATKIGANTNISDTEYGYLNGVSSNLQTQLDAKASTGFSTAIAIALS